MAYMTEAEVIAIAIAYGGGGGSGPYDTPDGSEVFNDDFEGDYTGWSVCSGLDPATSPSLDSSVGLLRAKAANPVLDIATDPSNLLVQPSHTAADQLSIYQDISGVLTFGNDWTIVAKMSLPQSYLLADNGITGAVGVSNPAVNDIRDEAVMIFAQEVDSSVLDWEWAHYTAGGQTSTEWAKTASRNVISPTYLLMMVHDDTRGDVICYGSFNNGTTWLELGARSKDPASFDTLFLYLGWIKHGSGIGEGIFRVHYLRAYDSVKYR